MNGVLSVLRKLPLNLEEASLQIYKGCQDSYWLRKIHEYFSLIVHEARFSAFVAGLLVIVYTKIVSSQKALAQQHRSC